jgi:hypothetical protein
MKAFSLFYIILQQCYHSVIVTLAADDNNFVRLVVESCNFIRRSYWRLHTQIILFCIILKCMQCRMNSVNSAAIPRTRNNNNYTTNKKRKL